MTETIVPYWVGNVAHLHFPPRPFHLKPDPLVPAYCEMPELPTVELSALKTYGRRMPVKTAAEMQAFSDTFQAQVEAKIAAQEAKRQEAQQGSSGVSSTEPNR